MVERAGTIAGMAHAPPWMGAQGFPQCGVLGIELDVKRDAKFLEHRYAVHGFQQNVLRLHQRGEGNRVQIPVAKDRGSGSQGAQSGVFLPVHRIRRRCFILVIQYVIQHVPRLRFVNLCCWYHIRLDKQKSDLLRRWELGGGGGHRCEQRAKASIGL